MTKQLVPIDTIKSMLVENRERIAKALPQHISPDRMIRTTLNCLESDENLLSCSAQSLYKCVIEASTYGWEIGGPLAEAYIVPFKSTATLIPGYRGLVNLVMRTGLVKDVIRQVVREGDTFEVSPLSDPPIVHTLGHERGGLTHACLTHAYCCARLNDGTLTQPVVMSRAEIDAHMRRYAKGFTREDSPWKTSFEKMALKTVIRQFVLGGYVQTSAEILDLVRRETVIEGSVVSRRDDWSEMPKVKLPRPDSTTSPELDDAISDWKTARDLGEALAACQTSEQVAFVYSRFSKDCKTEDRKAEVGLACKDREEELTESVTADGQLFETQEGVGQ